MTTVGYFCTGGHTEINGIEAFLKKINSNIKWKRCLPHCEEKLVESTRGEMIPVLDFKVKEHDGISGKKLVDKMFEILKDYGQQLKYDKYVIIDDFDCRFSYKEDCIDDWIKEQKKYGLNKHGLEVNFDVLFAAPEIEAWFISDWDNSFKKEYGSDVSYYLRDFLKNCKVGKVDGYIAKYWDSIENYGDDLDKYHKEYKLSEKIIEAFKSDDFYKIHERFNFRKCEYNKSFNGANMLRRIKPEIVEKKCRLYFAPFYRKYSVIS